MFPIDQLEFRVEIALGADINGDPAEWNWTDITDYVLTTDGAKIVINRGRRNDSGDAVAATATFELRNDDGRFEIDNPVGPYYPLLQVNTPVRIWVSPDAGATWYARYSGHLSKLPTRWVGAGASMSRISVTASSILKRLADEDPRSPLARTAPALASTGECLEYWPMEDGQAATECTSAVGGYPMTLSGSLETGRSSPPPGSRPTAMSDYEFMGTAQPPAAVGLVRPYTNTGEWTVLGCFKVESDAFWSVTVLDCDINKAEGSTEPDRVRLVVTSEKLVLTVYDEAENLLGTLDTGIISTRPPGDGEWHAVAVRAAQSGADVIFRIRYEGVTYSHTVTSKTLGTIRKASLPGPHINTAPRTYSVGHLAVYNDDLSTVILDQYAEAMRAYVGEETDNRISRASNESGLMYQITTIASSSSLLERLGEQPIANTIGIIQDAAEADGGIVFEPRSNADESLVYLARSSLYSNAIGTPALSIPLSKVEFLSKNDDDYLLSTKVTVSGAGSSATAAIDPVQNETAVSVNISRPNRLPDYAGWALFQGTRSDSRYPTIRTFLHDGDTSLLTGWLAADIGSRAVIPDPPPNVYGDIDTIIEGYAESIDQYSWTADLYCSPASRWRTAQLDHTTYGRMDTASSRLVNAVTSSATTMDVETVEGPEWSTTASGFDVGVGGERMTVASIAGSFSDTFTRTVANGWGTSTSGHAWSTTGGVAADYSVNGTRGIIGLSAVNSLRSTYITGLAVEGIDRTFTVRVPVLATGAGIQVRAAARWDVAGSSHYLAQIQIETTASVTLALRKTVAGVNTTLRTKTLPLTHTATTDYRLRFRVVGPWLYAKVWTTSTAEPPQWSDVAYDTDIIAAGAWGIRCALLSGNTNALPVNIEVDDDATLHPQRFTVTRAVNGVAKSHAAGAAFGLFQPNYLGL